MSRAQNSAYILNAVASASTGTALLVQDYIHLVIALDTANNANFTVKIQGSIQEDLPDFSAAQSASNQWGYIQIKDLEDESPFNGSVGVSAAGTDDHRMFEINENGLRWVCATITAYTAGNITLTLKPFKN